MTLRSCAGILFARHPAAPGQPSRAVGPEIWDVLAPLVERTLVGCESHRMSDIPLTMQRRGHAERSWFTYSHGPVRDGPCAPAPAPSRPHAACLR